MEKILCQNCLNVLKIPKLTWIYFLNVNLKFYICNFSVFKKWKNKNSIKHLKTLKNLIFLNFILAYIFYKCIKTFFLYIISIIVLFSIFYRFLFYSQLLKNHLWTIFAIINSFIDHNLFINWIFIQVINLNDGVKRGMTLAIIFTIFYWLLLKLFITI